MKEEIVADFRNAALRFFAPIAEKHGSSFVATSSTEYSISLKGLTLRVRLIPSHVPDPVVSVFADDAKWMRESPLASWGVNLLKFVQYQDEQFNFADARLGSRADLHVKMAFLAELLTKYCEPLLRGDSSLWQSVARRAEDEVIQRSGGPHKRSK
jgi:hypothetical protein